MFVVPGLFITATFEGGKCSRSVDDMSRELLGALHASPYFHINGTRDHLLVASFHTAEMYIMDTNGTNGWGATTGSMTIAPHVTKHVFKSTKACVVPVGHQVR